MSTTFFDTSGAPQNSSQKVKNAKAETGGRSRRAVSARHSEKSGRLRVFGGARYNARPDARRNRRTEDFGSSTSRQQTARRAAAVHDPVRRGRRPGRRRARREIG